MCVLFKDKINIVNNKNNTKLQYSDDLVVRKDKVDKR